MACFGSSDAKFYETQTSPFSGKLHQSIIDGRFSLHNRHAHPDMLAYDRQTAYQKGIALIPRLESACLEGEPRDQCTLEQLIARTERGIVVTNFWYIRTVNQMDLSLTGMTRDGTFLIENGKVTIALRNFRLHDSPLRAFQNISGYTEPQEATSAESGKFLVPALRVQDFYFSSVSIF